ncbi:MAG: hypothetical protein JHC23_04915 [Sulfolobus sp.]|nr:hypothetical protein [Sulfolobus sp.]
MKYTISTRGKTFDFDMSKRVMLVPYSPEAITAVRGLYLLMRVIKGIPRIYGIPSGDLVESWKKEFFNRFLSLLKGETEVTKVYPQMDFEISTESLSVRGKIVRTTLGVEVEVKKAPEVQGSGPSAMLNLDYQLQRDLLKLNPIILPFERVGFFYTFGQFVFASTEERPSGIPKALGIAAAMINGLVTTGELRQRVKGMTCTGSPSVPINCDEVPLYSLTPDVIEEIVMGLALEIAKPEDVVIIEVPELLKPKERALEILRGFRSRLVLVSDQLDIADISS